MQQMKTNSAGEYEKDQLIQQLKAEINTSQQRAFEYDRLQAQLESLTN